MSTHPQGKDTSIIFQSPDQPAPKPLAPPEYRQQALRFVLKKNREQGLDSLSLSELALQLRDPSLREKLDPAFEPLSLASINAAVADLTQTHELAVNDRIVVFPPPASGT